MSQSGSTSNTWQQAAEETATGSLHLLRALLPDCGALRIMHKSILRAQAEVLKGFLEVVESKLEQTESRQSSRSEKIPVD